jgi:hypothetical protein
VHKVAKNSAAAKEVDKLVDEVLEILGMSTPKRRNK